MKHRPRSKNSILAALDIGSSKIACFIARMPDETGTCEVLGVGHQVSEGMKAGTVTDREALENAVRKTVHAAESMAAPAIGGYPLRDVILNVPGVHLNSLHCTADVHIMGQQVSDRDLRRVLQEAQDKLPIEETERCIHTIPAGYAIDGNANIREPRGMTGQNLKANIHVVTAAESALSNMTACVESSHLDIAALCAAPYAAGLAVLVEDEKELGCTVIDMGGGTTSFAVFRSGVMLGCGAVSAGGQHVTSDIARGLTTGLTDAERLKTLYGSAMATTHDDGEMINVPPVGEDRTGAPNHVPRSLLTGIIQPRVEEILELVRAQLHDSGLEAEAGRRVVLTGGGSQLGGIRELAQLVLDRQVRLGVPVRIAGLAETTSGPAFATTAGLLTSAAMPEISTADQKRLVAANDSSGETWWEQVKGWVRENW